MQSESATHIRVRAGPDIRTRHTIAHCIAHCWKGGGAERIAVAERMTASRLFLEGDHGVRTRDRNLGKVGTLQSLGITIVQTIEQYQRLGPVQHRARTVVSEALGWQVGRHWCRQPSRSAGSVPRAQSAKVGPSLGSPPTRLSSSPDPS